MPIFLTVQEVPGILRRKVRRVYDYLDEGIVPHVQKLKGGWLIPEADEQSYIAALPSS